MTWRCFVVVPVLCEYGKSKKKFNRSRSCWIETNTKCSFDRLNIMAISVHYSCSIHFPLSQLKAMPSILSNLLRRWTFQTSDLLLLTQSLTGSAYDQFLINSTCLEVAIYIDCALEQAIGLTYHIFPPNLSPRQLDSVVVSDVSYSPMDIAKIK